MDQLVLDNHGQAGMKQYASGDYADMHLTLGAAGGNAEAAVRLNRERYFNRRVPH